jgi:CheY-like chemotaxis protein
MSKILLVEDDNNLREIYEARLAAEGYEIVSAHDGEEALVVAKNSAPDLVISDVMMPKISGFEMLDILRNTDGLKDVKVIMLTALGQSEDQQRANSLGADRYLVKSQVTLEDIVKVAQDLLASGDATTPQGASAAPQETTQATSDVSAPAVPEVEAIAPATAEPVEPQPAAVATTPPATVDEPVAAVEPSQQAPASEPVSAPVSPVPASAPSAPLDSTVPEPMTVPAAAPVAASVSEPVSPPVADTPTSAAPTTQPVAPEAEEPVADIEFEAATNPAEPAATSTIINSATGDAEPVNDEAVNVEAQIEDFVENQLPATPPPTATPEAAQPEPTGTVITSPEATSVMPSFPAPEEPTDNMQPSLIIPGVEPAGSLAPQDDAATDQSNSASDAATNDNQLITNAVDTLVANAKEEQSPISTEAQSLSLPNRKQASTDPIAGTEPGTDEPTGETAETPDSSTPAEASAPPLTAGGVTHKKIIAPLDNSITAPPNLDELLAREEAKESGAVVLPPTATASDIPPLPTSTPDDDSATSTPPSGSPGEAITPSSGGQEPFDPNSIAL